ncbi:hypothetical protein [Empedobacter sp. GD03739]|uniref:hypothetical protein n=1 Tax=Empedobacter sp. GD03739 TaxID=2975376 RepID=UPI002448097F|nr:hypothetical protein [Empedobacter sp. GD03739]MDH1604106.1 hypothetical protein [Empedobacter sp. GD03739]
MKNKIFIFLVAISPNLFSQVGIGTEKPHTTLDINGTTNVSKEIRFNGTDAKIGTAGKQGDLISGNALNNNFWKNFDLPEGFLEGMVLTGSYANSTFNGVSFPGTSSSSTLAVPYTKGQVMASHWKELSDLNQKIKISKSVNLVTISVQTLVQTSDQNSSFACGIYLDDKLDFVRLGTVNAGVGNYRTLNLNATLSNMALGEHTIKFACAERNIPTGTTLNIGKPIITTNLNNVMAKTSSVILVLEKP